MSWRISSTPKSAGADASTEGRAVLRAGKPRRSGRTAVLVPLLVLAGLSLGLGAGLGLWACGSDVGAEAQVLDAGSSPSGPEVPEGASALERGADPRPAVAESVEGDANSASVTMPAAHTAGSPATAGSPGASGASVTAGATTSVASAAAITASTFVSTPRGGQLPGELLELPESIERVIVIDANNYEMYLYRHDQGQLVEDGDFFVAIGKGGRMKLREGDEKTPIGVYNVVSYLPGERLPEIYGIGALPLDYPNRWDRLQGRTGSGIWIHGTDKTDEGLEAMSSRGCLTLRNIDFEFLYERVEIRATPVIISDGIDWVTPEALENRRDGLLTTVEQWRRDWESRNTDEYLSHYSQDFRGGSMSLAAWSAHKRRVNKTKTYIEIGISELTAFGYPGEEDLALVTFDQSYGSNNYNRQTRKRQFWRQEEGVWRILYEESI